MASLKEKRMEHSLKVSGMPGLSNPKMGNPKMGNPKMNSVTPKNTGGIKVNSNKEPVSSNVNSESVGTVHSISEYSENKDQVEKVEVAEATAKSYEGLTYDELKLKGLEIAEKLNAISDELKETYLEREDVIDDIIRALVAEQHILLLGPPGTGKSALAKDLTSRLVNAKYFSYLFNKTSEPAELVGTVSIKNMEQDKFVRVTDGKLPEADIFFADEVFKSNSPTLNLMLPILNERTFVNDGVETKVPLKMMIAASNETPEEDEGLEALYDRILLKHWVGYLKDPSNKRKMMQAYNKRVNPFESKKGGSNKTTIDLQDLELLQYFKSAVKVDSGAITAFGKLIVKMTTQGMEISDRKINWCWDLMKANAVLNGRDIVIDDDVTATLYALWENLDDIDYISEVMTQVISPEKHEIKSDMKSLLELVSKAEDYHQDRNPDALKVCMELNTKFARGREKIAKNMKTLSNKGSNVDSLQVDLEKLVDRYRDVYLQITGVLLDDDGQASGPVPTNKPVEDLDNELIGNNDSFDNDINTYDLPF